MQNVHTLLKLAQLRWAGHVTRMPEERLPKKILYGKLEMGKRFHGGLKSDTKTPSKPPSRIPTYQQSHGNKLHRAEQSGEASTEEVLVNLRQKESAKPSRNVHSAKPELRHHQQMFCSDLCCSFCNRRFRARICTISHLRTHKQ